MSQASTIPDHDAVIAMFEEQARKEDAYFRLIADKIETDPSLLQIPLENIARWLANEHWAVDRLNEWKAMIMAAQRTEGGMKRLLCVLRDDSEEMRFFKGTSPLVGLLSDKEAEILL